MLEFLQALILVLHFSSYIIFIMHFSLYINDLPDDVICNVANYGDDTTLYSKCDQASELWQQLELSFELESDLQGTGLGQEVACSFQCCKNSTRFVWPVYWCYTGAIDVKMDGSVPEEKSSFKILG